MQVRWWSTLVLVLVLSCPAVARARRVRPRFEPTDLELEDTGVLELDAEFGLVRGSEAARLVMPDFELDLGVLPNLEIDLDGAYAVEGPDTGPFSLDHAAPDSLWLAAKIGLYDERNESEHTALALGLQAGPKLPVGASTHGLGVEMLTLVGTAYRRAHIVWNAGGFIDPRPDAQPGRPRGIEVGADVDIDLDAADLFSLTWGVSLVRFLSRDPDQLQATAGVVWSPCEALDLTLTALVGFLSGSDRYGLLLGVSPKLTLFH